MASTTHGSCSPIRTKTNPLRMKVSAAHTAFTCIRTVGEKKASTSAAEKEAAGDHGQHSRSAQLLGRQVCRVGNEKADRDLNGGVVDLSLQPIDPEADRD